MANYERMLTTGAIRAIVNNEPVDEPILQVLAYKDVTSGSPKRYRFMLSDGQYNYQCCILMGDDAEMVTRGQLERYTIFKLKRYSCSTISGKLVIIMMEPEVIASGATVGRKIGNPAQYVASGEKQPPSNVHMPLSSCESTSTSGSNEGFNGEKRKKIEGGGYVAVKAPPKMSSSNTLNAALSIPISTLSPYQSRWIIKGRVDSKSEMRRWSNAKGEGNLFSFDIMDDSGKIRVTAFKAEADKFFEQVHIDDVVLLSRGMIKPANKKFSTSNHEYEITLTSDSVLEQLNDDSSCPKITYNWVRIADIENQSPETFVDVAGIICSAGDLQTITQKTTNREFKKRDLQIVDQSEAQIRVTIWGKEANDFEFREGVVLVGRSLKVSDFNGRSLTSAGGSTIQYDPQVEIVYQLKGWFNRCPDAVNARNLSGGAQSDAGGANKSMIPLESITEPAVSGGLSQAYVDATIIQTGKPNAYKSCMTCNRKVIESCDSVYSCSSCDKQTTEFKYRVILKAQIADHTGNTWITLFHQDLERLLKIDFNESGMCADERSEEFHSLIGSLNHRRFSMNLRCRIENYNDRSRVNSICNSVNQYNPVEHGKRLLAAMNA